MRHFSLGQQWILFALSLLILGLLCYRFYIPSLLPSPEVSRTEIVIEVLGDVAKPGIHFFQNSPTVMDALHAAGDVQGTLVLTESQPEGLEAGTSLTVTKVPGGYLKVNLGKMEARKLLVFSLPLDLNQVSTGDLCLVPGIGEALAREIVAYRERMGKFQSVEELKDVKGIGDKKWDALKVYFVISQP